MRLRILTAGSLLLFACVAQAEDRMARTDDPMTSSAASIWERAAAEAPTTLLVVGDNAPGFSYLAPDGKWHPFSEIFSRGPVLLLFGAKATDLEGIMRTRAAFAELAITPAIVVQGRAVSNAAGRTGFAYPIIRDPMGVIADLFNARDARTLQQIPAYFVLDQERKIRAVHRGSLPTAAQLLAVSARTLGRPLPESAISSTEE